MWITRFSPATVVHKTKSTRRIWSGTFLKRAFFHALILPLFAACASEPVQLPSWDNIESASIEVQSPIRLPDMPSPVSFTETEVVFSLDGMRQLETLRIAAETNYSIAEANAAALVAQSNAFNELRQAGIFQRQIAVIRAELLQEERRDHFIDNLWHRGLIALGVGLAL